jgi:PAS domain S-box-containing protein
MKTPPLLSIKPTLYRLFSHPGFWIWTTIFLSILVTGSVSWLRFRQQQAVQLDTTKLESIRLARIDLSNGFLYTTLAGDPSSPFNQDEGLALLHQAITSLDQALIDLGPEATVLAAAFRDSASTFQDALTAGTQATASQPGKAASLRIAFHELERQADQVDMQTQQSLNRLSARLDSEFAIALGVSAFMLAGICSIVFLTGRAREKSEAALHKSEALLLQTQEVTRVGGWEYDIAADHLVWTAETYRIHEVPVDFDPTSVEKDIEFYAPEDRLRITAALRGVVEQGQSYDLELQLITAQGRKIWVRTVGQAERKGNKIVRVFGNILDITDRKQAEEALCESEDKFRYIFDHSVIGKSITSPSGEISVNKAFCEMLGYTHEEFQNQRWQDITHPDDIELTQRAVDLLLSGEKESLRFNKRYLHKSGAVVWVDVSTSLRRDQEGKPLYFITSISDITERKQTEAALQKTSTELQLIFKNMINAFVVWESVFDENGKYASFRFGQFNDAYAQIAKLKYEDVRGKDVFEVWPATEQSWVNAYGEVAVTGIPNTFDMYHEPTKGWYHCNVYRPTDSPAYICVIFEDITERKQAEVQLAERIEELRRWNVATLGRETRVLELKHEVNELLAQTGHPARYPSAETENRKEENL